VSKRQSNRPDRRLVPADSYTAEALADLAKGMKYGGSANHKLRPGDYKFNPPSNPRASKSVCDDRRTILKVEAARLFRQGVLRGMVSAFTPGANPKYVWTVDVNGEVYEAKAKPGHETVYHGYRLGEDDREMRDLIRREWKNRCQKY
jgi:hypothetical protein